LTRNKHYYLPCHKPYKVNQKVNVGGWPNINHDYKHIYPEMKYKKYHNYNKIINKHKPIVTIAKSSSIQTLQTLVHCVKSQLQALQFLFQFSNDGAASLGI
jgi:hypothetical protein